SLTLLDTPKPRNFTIKAYTLIVLGALLSTSAQATFLDIYENNVFFNSTTLGSNSLLHEGEAVSSGGINDFSGTGIDVLYSNTLDTNNLGSITWSFTNNTGFVLENAWLGGFLDLEIGHTFFDEYGQLVDVSGTGAGDSNPDSWEIDEPGYIFGDIYDNLSDGYLDKVNNVDSSFPDDVSLGLGFDLGTIYSGSTWSVTFEISDTNIGGLSITDPDSAATYFWNGSSTVSNYVQGPVSVPEPGSIALIIIGLFSTFISRRRKLNIKA
ncbi:PEP-CTERM sorting domain-containing protein, partial [Colwellia sp. E2M01]|uniref:PEP-CTERM sorting domain-containing protein n=1 Tax=Colwellia sp. E2M01 TaxID=2841561 RepID=UPI001C0978EA